MHGYVIVAAPGKKPRLAHSPFCMQPVGNLPPWLFERSWTQAHQRAHQGGRPAGWQPGAAGLQLVRPIAARIRFCTGVGTYSTVRARTGSESARKTTSVCLRTHTGFQILESSRNRGRPSLPIPPVPKCLAPEKNPFFTNNLT